MTMCRVFVYETRICFQMLPIVVPYLLEYICGDVLVACFNRGSLQLNSSVPSVRDSSRCRSRSTGRRARRTAPVGRPASARWRRHVSVRRPTGHNIKYLYTRYTSGSLSLLDLYRVNHLIQRSTLLLLARKYHLYTAEPIDT